MIKTLDGDTVRRLGNTASTLAELAAQAVLSSGDRGEIAIDFDEIVVSHDDERLSFDDYPIRKAREQQKDQQQHLKELRDLLIEVTPLGRRYQIVSGDTVYFDVDSTTELSLFRLVYGDFDMTPVEASYKATTVRGWLWDKPKRYLYLNDSPKLPPTKYKYNFVLFIEGTDDWGILLDQMFGLMSPARRPMARQSPRKRSQSPALAPAKKITSQDLQSIKVIKQVKERFILARLETNGEVIMFDQHAADERARLEHLLAVVDLTSVDMDKVVAVPFLHRLASNLAQFGFTIESADDGNTKVVAIPELLEGITDEQLKKALSDHLQALLLHDKPWILHDRFHYQSYPEVVLQTAYSVACKSAIKFGDKLSQKDMTQLLSELKQCRDPFHCAHGRPTMVTLDTSLMRNRSPIDKDYLEKTPER